MGISEERLQRLVDESDIRALLAKYPRALDRQDHALLASLFHPGAIDDHGVFNGPATGFVEKMRDYATPGFHWMHHNGTQNIEIDGDDAHAETYTLAFYRLPESPDKEVFLRVRYLDKLSRINDEWRISHRRVVYSPCHILKVIQNFPIDEFHLVESGTPGDPVYDWA